MPKPSDIANANIDDLLEQLTAKELIELTAGVGSWHTAAVPRLGIPAIKVSDGPNGVRGMYHLMGTPAKAIPCATALGATWDTELIGQAAAKLIADELKLRAAAVLLGPTVNIQRSPLGGRSFESYSEDPHLSGHIATAYISHIQAKGVGCCIKHFVMNDMEDDRYAYNVVASPRALREIYLMPFMIAEKYAKPWCYMTAYNRVHGTHISENPFFLKGILRTEWSSRALIMSDWRGTYGVSEALNAGLDLEMPGIGKWRTVENVNSTLRSKKVTVRTLKERAGKVLELVKKVAGAVPEVFDGDGIERANDTAEDVQLMRTLAASSIVLLKNEENLLPLDLSSSSPNMIRKIAVIGPNAKARLISGGGSAALKASYFVTPFEGILNAVKESGRTAEVDVAYREGCRAAATLPTLESEIVTSSGCALPGFTATWHSHSDENLTVVEEPLHTQIIDETRMLFFDPTPKGLTSRWSLRLKGYLRPRDTDMTYEFAVLVDGRAKLYIDGALIIDNWTHQDKGVESVRVTVEKRGIAHLKKGIAHEIFVEFTNVRGEVNATNGDRALNGSVLRIGGAEVIDADVEIEESVKLAESADVVVLVIGLNADWESSGQDRKTLELPGRTDELVGKIAAVNKRTVVVTQSGSAIEMPWLSSISALIHAWYLGNAAGDALSDVIFGKTNPSGRLSLTFPKRLEDTPSFGHFASQNGEVRYAEDLYVGYKHYIHAKVDPLFPFGFGLSYTSFTYSNLNITSSSETRHADDFHAQISLSVTNTGQLQGSETVQVYISLPPTPFGHLHPQRQLRGFSKVKDIKIGETKSVNIKLDKYAISYWEESISSWRSEKGEYKVEVGKSSMDIVLVGKIVLEKVFEWKGL